MKMIIHSFNFEVLGDTQAVCEWESTLKKKKNTESVCMILRCPFSSSSFFKRVSIFGAPDNNSLSLN